MMLIKCPNCEKEYSKRAEKCPECGLTLPDASKQRQKYDSEEKEKKRVRKESGPKRKAPYIIAISIAVIILGVSAIIFIPKNVGNSGNESQDLPLNPGKYPYLFYTSEDFNNHVEKTKTLNIYGQKFTFLIAPDHPNGMRIWIGANGYFSNISSNILKDPYFDIYDEFGNLNENCSIEMVIGDIDNDGIEELILVEDYKRIDSSADVYRIKHPYKHDILQYIGTIPGQSRYEILEDGHIISSYGSQGLFNEYEITKYDKLIEIDPILEVHW